jgi:iron(III) transport system permease protein
MNRRVTCPRFFRRQDKSFALMGKALTESSSSNFGSRLRSIRSSNIFILLVPAVVIAYLALVPFVTLIAASFQSDFLNSDSTWTVVNFVQAFSDPIFYRLMINSIVYASSTTIIATVLGTGLGWLYARTNVPLKRFGFIAIMIPFIMPGILYAIAWILLCSSQIGIYNYLAHKLTGQTLFNIYSLPGMVFVEALHNTPLAFLMSSSVFLSMDSTLEEAGRVAGFNQFGVFKNITLKLALPGILGAALLIFTRVVSGFEVPQLIGTPAHIFVFVSQIYAAIQSFPPNYGQASVLGDVLLVLCLGGLYLSNQITKRSSRFATISGKSFKPQLIQLGKWRWPCACIWIVVFIIVSAGPLAVIIWASLLPEYQVPSLSLLHKLSFTNYVNVFRFPDIIRSLTNSIIAALVTGFVTMALTTFAAYVVIKGKTKGRFILDTLAFLPITMPGIIVGIGILFWYMIAPLPFNLYGTLTILIVAFVTTHIPYGMRYMTAGMTQINTELEEAAVVSGASRIRVFIRIYFPLLVPSFTAGLIYTIITVFREVSTAIFLYTPNSQILSITVYTLWQNGEFPMTAALGILILLLVVMLFLLLSIINRRRAVSAVL